jgi:hypothetical protein
MTKTVQPVEGGTKKIPIVNPALSGTDLISAINDRLRRASGLQTKGKLYPGNAVTIDSDGFLVDGGPIPQQKSGATASTGSGLSINGVSGFVTVNGGALADQVTFNGH